MRVTCFPTRTDTPLIQVPQSVQVLTKTLIQEQDRRTLGDALVNVSGVTPTRSDEVLFIPPIVRGFPAEVYLDGLSVFAGNQQAYALLTAVVLVIMPTFTLLPLLVKQHFGGGAAEVALLESLGGVVVAVIVPRRLVSWILWGFTLSCATLALTALVPPGLFWLAAFFWALSADGSGRAGRSACRRTAWSVDRRPLAFRADGRVGYDGQRGCVSLY